MFELRNGPRPEERKFRARIYFRLNRRWPDAVANERLTYHEEMVAALARGDITIHDLARMEKDA